MAKRLEFDIVTDASKGIAGLKQFSAAAKKAMGDVSDSLDDTTTSAQKVAKALSGLADELETEMKGAAKAAEALAQSLGPEISSRANLDQVVGDLHKMGLTFDEITTDADSLAASLKKLDSVQMSGPARGMQDIADSTERTKKGVAEVGKSADSSKSALANMIGNSAQDLGALGGIAGSTGVAIGQMAEYMADAAFEGEGLASVLGSFAKVAGPIAAFAIAFEIVSSVMESLGAESEAAAKRVDLLDEAMQSTDDHAVSLADSLRKSDSELRNFAAVSNNNLGKFGQVVNDLAGKVPIIGSKFEQASIDVVAALGRAGSSVFEFAQAVERGGIDADVFLANMKAARDAGLISANAYNAIAESFTKYSNAARTQAKNAKDFAVNQREANSVMQAMLDQDEPMRKFGAHWKVVMQDMADGSIDTKAAADSINFLNQQLGLTPQQIEAIAKQGLDDQMNKDADAAKAATDAFKNNLDTLQTYVEKVGDASKALKGLEDPFEVLARKGDTLASIFHLGNAPIDFLSGLRDIDQGMRDFAKFVKEDLKGKIPDIFNPKDLNADDFLSKIKSLRDPIQQEIADTFAVSTPEAAKKTADNYVDQLFQSLGGKLSKDKIRTLLGLDDLTARIQVSIDQSSLKLAQDQLDILRGLSEPHDMFVAQVQYDLDAGNITPAVAQQLLDRALQGKGVTITANPEVPDEATQNAINGANMYAAAHPGLLPTESQPPTDKDMSAMVQDAQQTLDGKALSIKVKPFITNKDFDFLFKDAGGTVGPGGGIVAERRPEIVDGKYLVMTPTVVPPGTRVTSGAKTARILRSRGSRGLKRYDAGGTVPANVTNNVTLHLPAGANGADVVRQVKRWQRRNGTPG